MVEKENKKTNYGILMELQETYISDGAPTIICVSLSLKDIYRDPPPLRTRLTNLRISEASNPISNILHSDRYKSLSSDCESLATSASTFVSPVQAVTSPSPSLTKAEESENIEDIFCERVASTSKSPNPEQGTDDSAAIAEGLGTELPITLSWTCWPVKQVFMPLFELTRPPWTGYDSSLRHATHHKKKISMLDNLRKTCRRVINREV